MRIGVDAHILTDKYQGSRTHLINLLRNLATIDGENEYLIYSESLAESQRLFGEVAERFEHRAIGARGPLGRLVREFPQAIQRDGLDLFYSQFISPVFARCRCAVTIHDLLFESLPQFFSPMFVFRSRLLIRRSARRAAVVFTDSQFSRREILDRYGIEPEKVHLTPCAVNRERFRPLAESEFPPSAERFREHQPFILYVGRLDPRKNVEGLIRALALRKRRKRTVEKLVICGPKDYRHRKVFETIKSKGMTDNVEFLEGVSDEELPALYNLAEVFAFPSFGEGFGLPVLEAMACGTPVITTNRGSLAEVAGDAARLVDPSSPEAIEGAIDAVCGDDARRERMRQRGLKQAAKFDWQESARVFYRAIQSLE